MFLEGAINQSGGGEEAPGCVQAGVYSAFIQKQFLCKPIHKGEARRFW